MAARIDNTLTLRLDAAIDRAINSDRIVGTVLMVVHNGEMVYARAAGFADREARRPMQMDAIFRLASLTKPIVATAALAMMDARVFGLDDCVSDHLTYFQPRTEDWKPAVITVRHLLTHTSGLSYDSAALKGVDAAPGQWGALVPLAENVRRLGEMPLKFAPGTGWEYGTSLDVLGGLVAQMNRSTLEDAVKRYVTGPLWMDDTRFSVTDPARLAVPYGDAQPMPRRMGDPHVVPSRDGGEGAMFVPSRIFNPEAPQSGGSGMAGTCRDYITFLEMIRSGGGSVLRPETARAAIRNQIGEIPRRPKDAGQRFSFIGAVVDDPAAARSPVGRGTVNWGGSYGHNWFIDLEAKLTVASFSNTAAEGCDGPYREEIRDAIYE